VFEAAEIKAIAGSDVPGWAEARRLLRERPELLREDSDLLQALGLRPSNVVEFGPAALARLEAARARETTARQEVEALARANFHAQAQTHALIVDLLHARNNADLARRVQQGVEQRFGLAAGAIAIEGPGSTPAGWRAMPCGMVDLILGGQGMARMGPAVATEELFGPLAEEVKSLALIRLAVWSPRRQGVLAFGSREPLGFTPHMGVELVAFLARVVEQTADRWPPRL
jgi:uncharacterized protein YigA (DUF484 family)